MNYDKKAYREIWNYQGWLIHRQARLDRFSGGFDEFIERTNVRKRARSCRLNDYDETPGSVKHILS